jgi:hypothetical protein
MARRASTNKRARANVARARARSQAALKGWKTRRENALARTLAAKKAARTRARKAHHKPKPATVRRRPKPEPERRDYLVSFSFSAGKREYRRDLVVPAPVGTSPAQLIARARAELPKGAADLEKFLTRKNATIYEGPISTRKRTELR